MKTHSAVTVALTSSLRFEALALYSNVNEIGINKHIQTWARKNTDEHVREIMECYLKDLCSDFKKELRVISSGTNAT